MEWWEEQGAVFVERLQEKWKARAAVACLVAATAKVFYVRVSGGALFPLMGFARRRVSKGCGFLVALLS